MVLQEKNEEGDSSALWQKFINFKNIQKKKKDETKTNYCSQYQQQQKQHTDKKNN